MAQLVEDVGFARGEVGDAVGRGVGGDARHGVGRDVEGLDRLAPRRQRQRKPAVVAEAVEQRAVRVARGGLAVLALIEKQARSSARATDRRRRSMAPSRTAIVSGTVAVAATSTFCSRPSSSRTLGSLRASTPLAPVSSTSSGTSVGHQAIHALRQRLHHQVVAIAIDDQRRQQVGFAVNQPVGGGVDLERCRESGSRVSSRSRQNAASIGRSSREIIRSVICDWSLNSAWPSTRSRGPRTCDHDAGLGADDVGDVGAIDPGMAGANAVFASWR